MWSGCSSSAAAGASGAVEGPVKDICNNTEEK
jgi:hypothetical protein